MDNNASVTATPCMGINMPLSHFAETRDFHPVTRLEDSVGEAVGQAVENAWKSGIDPAIEPFMVIVTFNQKAPQIGPVTTKAVN